MNIALGSHLTLEQKVRVGSNGQPVKIESGRPFMPVRNVGRLRPLSGYNKIAGRNKLGVAEEFKKTSLKGSELPVPEDSYEVKRRIKLKPVLSNINGKECKHVQIHGTDLEFGTVQANVNGWKSLKVMAPHGGDMHVEGVTTRREHTPSDNNITQKDLDEAENSAFGHQKESAGPVTGVSEILKKGIDTIPKKRGAITNGNNGKSGYSKGGYGAKNVSWGKKN